MDGRFNIPVERRANLLSGRDWLKNSISVWGDLTKTKEERQLKHPASFPTILVDRILQSFLNISKNGVVLDPFSGTGSTLLAACQHNQFGIGFELYDDFITISNNRLALYQGQYNIIKDSAYNINQYIAPESVNLVVTSPPYWNVLNRFRTVLHKESLAYGNNPRDLGNLDNYDEFLKKLINIFIAVSKVLKPRSYMIIDVMDIRVKESFYPFHMDLARGLLRANAGLFLDDIIIWDRKNQYNRLRPIGFPYKFRINRVHEYLLIFCKGQP